MSVNELIDLQSERLWRISRAIENLRKIGESKVTIGQVTSRIALLDTNWEKFQATHDELRHLKANASPEQLTAIAQLPYFKTDLYAQCEEQFALSKGSMIDILETIKQASPPSTQQVTEVTPAARPHSRRLPPIELPTFAGSYSDWKPFHDLFSSMISKNAELSAVEKLHYLKKSLIGEPSQLIRNLAVTGENFTRAWETLVLRYENKRLMIDSHLASLFAIPRISKKSAAEVKRLHSDTCEALGALATLGSPVRQWDHIIVHMTVRKLDPASLEEWERRVSEASEPSSLADLEAFLLGRIHTLEAVEQAQGRTTPAAGSTTSQARQHGSATRSHVSQSEASCSFCQGSNYIASCKSFQDQSVEQRKDTIITKKLCFNCLGPHAIKDCRSQKRCRSCQGRHHTLLHRSNPAAIAIPRNNTATETASVTQSQVVSNSPSQVSSNAAQSTVARCSPILLATVQVRVVNPKTGEGVVARALLDQGSQSSFISESLAQNLRLTRRHASVPVIGVGAHQAGITRGLTVLQIQSRVRPSFSCKVDALVLPRVTSFLPSSRLLVSDWPHLHTLSLADPQFAEPGNIDLILGADIYGHVLLQGTRKGVPGTPIAQETELGWILSGPTSSEPTALPQGAVQGFQCSVDHELLELMQRFWIQEEISRPIPLTPDEEHCEQHFQSTVSREATGLYVVRLPCKDNSVVLGNSRTPALQTLHRMEKRFATNEEFKTSYSNFLNEYRELGHMHRAATPPEKEARAFYLPHHAVLRDHSSTTKLRVVFNGSQQTEKGLSLNDNLHSGPKIQTDLLDVLLRWRQHPVAFSADIVKMYRQIRVHTDDWDLQRILWRDNPNLPIEEFQLCTVTYGLACAPYLAIRVLHQLVQDEGNNFPLAGDVILDNAYVDDILFGAESPTQCQEKIHDLIQLLKAGGFELKKWTSSHSEVLADIAPSDRESAGLQNLDQSPFFRALGLAWRPDKDAFTFVPQPSKDELPITKRKVLAETAQLFDPLGWLSPVTIRFKILMQELWTLSLTWEDPIPEPLASQWSTFRKELQDVALITIPRWMGLGSTSPATEIHGFADASQHAIAAVVYLRTYIDTHVVRVALVCSKTKVAPLKRLTIPRLELCAALLLVRLVCQVKGTLKLANVPSHLWTDSTVALAWIKSHPARWKDFVRNRVTEIQEFPHAHWRHISGSENPADIASRGASTAQVSESQLWICGPAWLAKPSVSWPHTTPSLKGDEDLEEKKHTSAHQALVESLPPIWDLIDRYSSWTRLLRITAICSRAAAGFLQTQGKKASAPPRANTPITTSELEQARLFWVKKTQEAYFQEEIRQMQSKAGLTRSSSLHRLTPFFEAGLLRVGGRLRHSSLPYDEKHPLILPRESALSRLIIGHVHRATLHGGPQLTLATIRQQYWILGGRVPVRAFINRCVPCARQRATLSTQRMGQLPHPRVTQSRPFLHSGVDHAGPFAIRASRGRNPETYKGYIVLFVCFSTSAIHLELVSDYTTDAFIAAYKRFTSRRGICATLSSDCGTNLVGADAELRRLLAEASTESANIANVLASHGTQWRFNPPSAPHFGGKWEAGVESTKFHIKRVVGGAKLTFEQFETFLTQVEAVLNSRPLCTITDDPRDSGALTPGHFLIGTALNTIPEPSLTEVPVQRLSHWQHSRHMLDHFWKRWSSEYLQTFQPLPKWQSKHRNLEPGAIVLIKDENSPPSVWPLAKILEVHPGTDGLVRVVTVKTKSSVLKRPIAKLCVLPVNSSIEVPSANDAS